MTKVAFDVDETLIDENDQPKWEIRSLLVTLYELGCDVIVWSGGGKEYAEMWGRRLFLPEDITYLDKPIKSYNEGKEIGDTAGIVDIAFDDMSTNYGLVNIKV
jgi:predicted HAD superfamily phosphohydrolase YqeG